MIDDAVEDGPTEVQGPDTLVIRAEVPGHGTLHRRVTCPLPAPGSGRRLVGRVVGFRHVTLDRDDLDDILVVRWPREAGKALEPSRPEGPEGFGARAWTFLAGCSAVIAVGGILLSTVMLIGIVFTGGELFADLPAWFHPGVALAVCLGAVVLGVLAFAGCHSRIKAGNGYGVATGRP